MVILNAIFRWAVIPGILMISGCCFCQIQTHSFEDLDKLQKTTPKDVLIFLHTDWCVYCQSMENTTFKNREIERLLTDDFYFIEMDAEQKGDIHFFGHTFSFKPTGGNTGIHELAAILGSINGELSYPTLVFMNSQNELIYRFGGFMSSAQLKSTLIEIKKLTKP